MKEEEFHYQAESIPAKQDYFNTKKIFNTNMIGTE
jgi:hypothetical protein